MGPVIKLTPDGGPDAACDQIKARRGVCVCAQTHTRGPVIKVIPDGPVNKLTPERECDHPHIRKKRAFHEARTREAPVINLTSDGACDLSSN